MHLTAKLHHSIRLMFGSYRLDKQTDKQTDAAENIHIAPLCYTPVSNYRYK